MAYNVDNHSRLWWAMDYFLFMYRVRHQIYFMNKDVFQSSHSILNLEDLRTHKSFPLQLPFYLARRTTVGAVSQQKARRWRHATAWSSPWCGTWPTRRAPRAPLAARQLFTSRRIPRVLFRFPSIWVRIQRQRTLKLQIFWVYSFFQFLYHFIRGLLLFSCQLAKATNNFLALANFS